MPDPLRSFRGVVVATLVLEGVVVLLTLPWVARLGEGVGTYQGALVGALALAVFAGCAIAGRPWAVGYGLALQGVMILCWFVVPAIGIVGAIFGVAWACLWWFRHDVAKRMAQGRLPGQQQGSTSD